MKPSECSGSRFALVLFLICAASCMHAGAAGFLRLKRSILALLAASHCMRAPIRQGCGLAHQCLWGAAPKLGLCRSALEVVQV